MLSLTKWWRLYYVSAIDIRQVSLFQLQHWFLINVLIILRNFGTIALLRQRKGKFPLPFILLPLPSPPPPTISPSRTCEVQIVKCNKICFEFSQSALSYVCIYFQQILEERRQRFGLLSKWSSWHRDQTTFILCLSLQYNHPFRCLEPTLDWVEHLTLPTWFSKETTDAIESGVLTCKTGVEVQ